MKKMFRFYELILMYFIALIYFIIILFRVSINENINLRYIFFEAVIVALVLVIIREVIMYKRLKKLSTNKIIEYSTIKYLFRMILVVAFYSCIWFSSNKISNILVMMTGPVLIIVLPRPISERFYVMESGYILGGIYYDHDSIDEIKFSDSGILEIINNGEKTRVLRHNKNQKNIIYQHLRNFERLE